MKPGIGLVTLHSTKKETTIGLGLAILAFLHTGLRISGTDMLEDR